MHMQMVQCNAWLHFRQRTTSAREIFENFISILQCTCKWCNAMHDFTSLYMQMVQCNAWLHFYPQIPRKGVRGATTLLYLNVCCCTGTYCTNPATVSSYAYSIWECKCMIAMHELHIPPMFLTPSAKPQVDKHINPQIKQNSDFIWLVWASEI